MADFFLSAPGLLATAGIGALILLRGSGAGARPRATRAGGRTGSTLQVAISAVVLAAGLWVILGGASTIDSQRWASGAIGTVMGYWLKP
jgi:hypothetical protein